jgi:hypothetical protein
MSSLTSKSTVKNLKLALLFQGVSLDDDVVTRLQSESTKFGHGLFDYSGKNQPLQIPQEIWLDHETVVRLAIRPDSHLKLRFAASSFVITDEATIVWPVQLSPRPAFYDLELSDGSRGYQHCQINGSDRINIYAFNFCSFTAEKVACRFCNVSESGKNLQTVLLKKAELVASVVCTALNQKAFNHFCFSGGVIHDADRGHRLS